MTLTVNGEVRATPSRRKKLGTTINANAAVARTGQMLWSGRMAGWPNETSPITAIARVRGNRSPSNAAEPIPRSPKWRAIMWLTAMTIPPASAIATAVLADRLGQPEIPDSPRRTTAEIPMSEAVTPR